MSGTPSSVASRRARAVFPTPIGPSTAMYRPPLRSTPIPSSVPSLTHARVPCPPRPCYTTPPDADRRAAPHRLPALHGRPARTDRRPPHAAFFAEHPPGGVILFRRNVRSAAQLRALVAALHEGGAGVRPLIAIDHEGGRVHRLPRPFTHFPPAAIIGATDDPHAAEAVGRAMGRELAAVGIDLDFAPVLDVWSNPRNRVIGEI